MAVGATEFIDVTTADVFIPEIWSSQAIVARENTLVSAQMADKRYEKELRMGDILHVPSISNLAARTKAANTAITYETITETNTDITVNKHDYAAIAVESIVKVQANRDMLSAYSGKMGYALGQKVDAFMAGLFDNFSQTKGTLGTAITDAIFRECMQLLDDANVPGNDRYYVTSPADAYGLLAIDKFINNDYSLLHGSERPANDLERAYITSFYHVPIYQSTNIVGTNANGHRGAMWQKEALALIMQMSPKTHNWFDIDYLTDKVAMEQLYGGREMRDDHGIYVKTA